jgi:hypothetical protein
VHLVGPVVDPQRVFTAALEREGVQADAQLHGGAGATCVALTIRRRGRATLLLAGSGLALIALGAASPASAQVTCTFSSASHRLIVRSSAGGDEPQLERQGNRIIVKRFLGSPRSCQGGTATVFNTDTIKVRVSGFVPGIDIRLDGGPFAPGATPEKKGASEIEVHVTGKDAMADVIGTPGPDQFRWGRIGNSAGLNVNAGRRNDTDVDISAGGLYAFIVAEGGKGRDTILPARPLESVPGGAFSVGGGGNDILAASRNGDIIGGGAGRDLIRGGPSFDWIGGGAGKDRVSGAGGADAINPGGGQDIVLAGPGRDFVKTQDSQRDRVKCGGGSDGVRADRFDRLSNCERVRGGGAGGAHHADSVIRLRERNELRLRRSLRLAKLRR